ncbi:MAB_1171c family putative transporter [Amycolatopsis sp. H20-H5]|uniref:MAB_1171c family putative transporter n=1 Tax=Amycolatopsis sp. H20-H5 TaxID=3046309 RepID=UPI002DBF0154|nr:MAB_1171c family putative transporter [Amycolatopsis sp. H20-H5]MEC3982690.1 MAB_1171c family putative transporter [Amycolatopsis sp. H20-H5]
MKTLFNPVTIPVMVLFALTLGWRVYQLQRAPKRLPLWAVTIAIAFIAAAFLFQQQPVDDWLDGLAGKGAGRLANNVLLSSALCSLLIFFLGSTPGPRRRFRAAAELVPLAMSIALMCVATASTPFEDRGEALSPDRVHIPGIALFYLGAGLYLIYGLSSCVGWIVRYQRTADRVLRTGLRISAAGLAASAAGSVTRALYIVIAWAFGPTVPFLLLLAIPLVSLGTVAFLVGITYPGARARLSALRRRRLHRRDHRRLAPLWTLLVRAYPSIELRAGPLGFWERLRPRTVHRRYYRRVIEIRDGLVQLSPYLDTDLTTLAVEDPGGAAAALEAALNRQNAGEQSGHQARLVLPGETNDLESEVRPLLALAAALPEPA